MLSRSPAVRPTRTAAPAIGSDRKRSTMPRRTSSARPMAVIAETHTALCTMTPGIRYAR